MKLLRSCMVGLAMCAVLGCASGERERAEIVAQFDVPPPPLEDRFNALPLWRMACEAAVYPPFDHEIVLDAPDFATPLLPGFPIDDVRVWMEQNREAERLLQQGIERGNLRYPDSAFPFNDPPSLGELRRLSDLLSIRARLLLMDHKPADARQQLVLAHRMAHLMDRHARSFIQVLFGGAMLAMADRNIAHAAADPAFDELALRSIISELEKDEPRPLRPRTISAMGQDVSTIVHDTQILREAAEKYRAAMAPLHEKPDHDVIKLLDKTVGSVFQMYEDLFRVAAQLEARTGRRISVIDPRATQDAARACGVDIALASDLPWLDAMGIKERLDADAAKELAETDSALADAQAALAADPPVDAAKLHVLADRFENIVGRQAVAQTTQAHARFLSSCRQMVATRRAALIRVALQAYARNHTSAPPSLDALVAEKILARLPLDPFGSGTFRYDPVRRRFWSVGENGVDDGGTNELDVDRGPDMVWGFVASSRKPMFHPK